MREIMSISAAAAAAVVVSDAPSPRSPRKRRVEKLKNGRFKVQYREEMGWKLW
jgi:hypothetical protein